MKKAISVLIILFMLLPITIVANESEQAIYEGYVEEISEQYGVCPELIQSMIYYESNWNAKAKSKSGAIGLMQIIPKWNKDRMKRLGVTDLYDPYSNILVGVDLLMELAEEYEPYEALAAYNMGKYSKGFKKVLDGGSCKYSEKILKRSEELEKLHGKLSY